MLLRKFSYDDHGNKSSSGKGGSGASSNVERWPQPMWQDRGKTRKGSNAATGTEAAASATKSSSSHNRVVNDTPGVKAASVPRSAHLQRLSPEDAEYGRVLKLAARYLNPTHLVFASGAGSLVEVESVDKIVCPAARNEFDQLSSALGVTSATSASVVVSKFLQCYDRTAVSKKAVVGADAWLSGPAGPALYFGNVFALEGGARSPDGSKGQTAAPAEGEVLLCDVAAGRMCLNPSNSLVDDLHQAAELAGSTAPTSETSPSPGSLAAMSALSSKGFDSITTSVAGTPHLTVFDGARVLPTHLVRFRQRTSPQRTAPRGNASTEAGTTKPPGAATREKAVDGGDSSPDSTPKKQVAGHGASPSSPEVAAARAVQSLARTQADREATVAGARRTAQRLRQQFRDLEEALHAKRDYLLALVRREEEGALAALHKQERGLQQQLGGAGALRPATAAADGQELASRGRFSPGLAPQSSPSKSNGDSSAEAGTDPFASVVLDTGRMMALIEHLSLEGLSLTEGAAASSSSEGSGPAGVASRPGSNMGSRRPGSSSAASLFAQKSEFQPANRGARDDHRPPSSSSASRPSGASRRQSLPTAKAEPLIESDALARTSGDASNSVGDAPPSSSSAQPQGVTAKTTTTRARPTGAASQEASSSSSGNQSRRSTQQPLSRNSTVPEPLAITRPMTSPGPGQTPGAGAGRLGGVGGAGVRVAPKLGMVRAPARLPQSNSSGAQRPPTGSKGAPRTQQR